jgi:hypothetical protein
MNSKTAEDDLDMSSPILRAENAAKVELCVFYVCSLLLPKA